MAHPETARQAVSEAADLRDALRRLAGALAPRWDVARASLRTVDRSDDRLVIAAVWARDGTVLTEGTRIPLEATSYPDVVKEGGPVVFEAVTSAPTLLDQILLDEGLQSWAVIPLRRGGAVAALLALSATVPGTFTASDREELHAVAEAVEEHLLGFVHTNGRTG